MSRADYRRPADYQIRHHYRCTTCGHEQEFMSDQTVEGGRCGCGGSLTFSGESYPASAEDWDEERDTQDGQWRHRR